MYMLGLRIAQPLGPNLFVLRSYTTPAVPTILTIQLKLRVEMCVSRKLGALNLKDRQNFILDTLQ